MTSARKKIKVICKRCGIEFYPLYASAGLYCSLKCSVRKDNEHHAWKNKLKNYTSIHSYLRKFKKGLCQFCNKKGFTHYALKKGKKHERLLENYFELCVSCHAKYDDTEDKRIKRIKSLKKTYSHQNPIKEKSCKFCKKMFLPKKKSRIFCSNSCSAKGCKKWLALNDK